MFSETKSEWVKIRISPLIKSIKIWKAIKTLKKQLTDLMLVKVELIYKSMTITKTILKFNCYVVLIKGRKNRYKKILDSPYHSNSQF